MSDRGPVPDPFADDLPAGLTDPVPAGLHVAIVAPGGYAPDAAGLARALARLRAFGCRVTNLYDPDAIHQRFGGTDAARAAQIHAAIADPSVDLIIALRGGYGLTRLLPMLDLPRIAASGKRIVGHSDVTALQLALLREGAPSFAGPMICDDFTRDDLSEYTMSEFWRCLRGPEHAVRVSAAGNPAADVEGVLWGGNLAMLVSLIGTPWIPRVRDGILFIEDVNEHPYRVERMLLQLFHAGVLEGQRAVMLGKLSGYRLTPYDNGYDLAAMVAYLRERLSVPLLTGLPFGHIRDKTTLPVGGHARLQSEENGFELSVRAYAAMCSASA